MLVRWDRLDGLERLERLDGLDGYVGSIGQWHSARGIGHMVSDSDFRPLISVCHSLLTIHRTCKVITVCILYTS